MGILSCRRDVFRGDVWVCDGRRFTADPLRDTPKKKKMHSLSSWVDFMGFYGFYAGKRGRGEEGI
jgi:hypothetical protein